MNFFENIIIENRNVNLDDFHTLLLIDKNRCLRRLWILTIATWSFKETSLYAISGKYIIYTLSDYFEEN